MGAQSRAVRRRRPAACGPGTRYGKAPRGGTALLLKGLRVRGSRKQGAEVGSRKRKLQAGSGSWKQEAGEDGPRRGACVWEAASPHAPPSPQRPLQP